MKKTIFAFLALALFAGLGHPVHAQTDPAADASLVSILAEDTVTSVDTDVNLPLITKATEATASATADTLTMMSLPTIITGSFAGMDGGASTNATAETTDLMPALAGATSVSTPASLLEKEEEADVTTDEDLVLANGNSAVLQIQRQRLITTNLQGQAYSDLKTYGTRFIDADTMEAKLSAVKTIKEAETWNGGVELQVSKGLDLVGQSISLNTAAVAEQRLEMINETLRVQNDHQKTADAYKLAAVLP